MSVIKVALVDDHQIVRDGIRSLLTGIDDIEVIIEACDAMCIIERLKIVRPDVLIPDVMIVDISLPEISGIELTRIVTSQHPSIKIIMLSMYTNQEFIFNAIKAGAKGYLPKNITRDELLDAIREVYKGNEYFSKDVSNIILKSYLKQVKDPERFDSLQDEKLTNREMEILRFVAEGYSNQLIADKLFISVRTVESHKNHIMQKLELTTTVDLVKYALKNKIIDL